jgi:hypothetical protein
MASIFGLDIKFDSKIINPILNQIQQTINRKMPVSDAPVLNNDLKINGKALFDYIDDQ